MKRRKCGLKFFTLVEVIVSMAVFAILMLGLMQFFSSAQGLWTSTSNKSISFDEARTAVNMLALDLMCAYYEEGRTIGTVEDHRYFFMVQDSAYNAGNLEPALGGSRYKGIAFATIRAVKTNADAITRLTEVFYRKNGNLLEMKTIADNEYSTYSPALAWVTAAQGTAFNAFTATPFAPLADAGSQANSDAGRQTPEHVTDGWTAIASNVVRFYVKCYASAAPGTTPSNPPLAFNKIFNTTPDSVPVTKFPGFVIVTLITVDDDTARRLRQMEPSVSIFENYLKTDNDEIDSTYEDKPAGILLKEKMQTFTKTIYLDRGIN